ncbi:MAG TPA: hypothetical protein VGA87_10295, partial [Pyrinomonadaceae bacterium]
MALLLSVKVRRTRLRHVAQAFVLLLAASSLPCAPALHAQEAPAGQMRLSRIEVSGLQRVTQGQVVEASGLEIGQQVDVAALDAAAERLLGTGLFTKLGYRYRTKGVEAVVTFEVEESKAER